MRFLFSPLLFIGRLLGFYFVASQTGQRWVVASIFRKVRLVIGILGHPQGFRDAGISSRDRDDSTSTPTEACR